eukprot:TRINITY_DN18510_c0_g2_i2.p1 TRINITY_DN18510_c0_g2~~TRINITY_DN18510_c0_g2_i2.p1  ORF type:complete len:723 (-),score=120.96 TRINITY_DN18510_c0_g2_i2:196-2112(-)
MKPDRGCTGPAAISHIMGLFDTKQDGDDGPPHEMSANDSAETTAETIASASNGDTDENPVSDESWIGSAATDLYDGATHRLSALMDIGWRLGEAREEAPDILQHPETASAAAEQKPDVAGEQQREARMETATTAAFEAAAAEDESWIGSMTIRAYTSASQHMSALLTMGGNSSSEEDASPSAHGSQVAGEGKPEKAPSLDAIRNDDSRQPAVPSKFLETQIAAGCEPGAAETRGSRSLLPACCRPAPIESPLPSPQHGSEAMVATNAACCLPLCAVLRRGGPRRSLGSSMRRPGGTTTPFGGSWRSAASSSTAPHTVGFAGPQPSGQEEPLVAASPEVPFSDTLAEGVATAARQGRMLEAAQRLRDGPASLQTILPQDLLSSIEEQAAAVNLGVKHAEEARATSSAAGSGWSRWTTAAADLVYKYDWHTGHVEVIGDVHLDIPPLHVWTILREYQLLPTWSRALHSTLLRSLSANCELYHVQSRPAAAMLSPSESYTVRTYVDALDELGSLMVVCDAPPEGVSEFKGVRIPPPEAPYKRLHSRSRDTLTPISPTSSLLTVYRRVNTNVPYLPNMVVGLVASILVNGQISALQALAEAWEESEYARLLRSGPRAAMYAALTPRLEAAMQRRSAKEQSAP